MEENLARLVLKNTTLSKKDVKKNSILIMGKRWTTAEVAVACKAFASATNDSIKGADQRAEDFNQKLVEILQQLSPASCEEGTYYFRGDRVFPYLRDNVFPDVQKFNKARRIVEASSPSGVTDDQKINMAVAIHLRRTKKMEYQFKDFNSTEWRFYSAWKELHKLPKFSFSAGNAYEEPEDPSADEEVPGTVFTADGSGESSVSTSTSLRHEKARGGGKGRGNAIKQRIKEEEQRRKRERDSDRDKKFNSLVEAVNDIKNVMRKKQNINTLGRAIELSTDPEVKARLEKKLISIADELEF